MVLPIVAVWYVATTLGALALAPIALAVPQINPNNDIQVNKNHEKRLLPSLVVEAPLGTFQLGVRALM